MNALTHHEKQLAVAIWTSEAFQGSRDDAARLARDQVNLAPDLFAHVFFEHVESEQPPLVQDHPDQLYLF